MMAMRLVAGIDLGGTAINYTFLDEAGHFRIDGLCEHPARSVDGPDVCLAQIADGLAMAADRAGIDLAHVVAIGLDTPGPATAAGVLSNRGSTNFVHPAWAGFDIRGGVERRLGKPVVYLNDGNAAALWGHVSIFGSDNRATSLSAIIGTGLGGGVITEGRVVTGRNGFGGELGHVLIPWHAIPGIEGIEPQCNCGRTGDLESLCSLTAIRRTLLPFFLARNPGHALASLDAAEAAKRVRGLAVAGDAMCRTIFQVQARALALFFDEMINIFDPDALVVGGGALEASPEFQRWFLDEIRAGMPPQRTEQAAIGLHVIPNGDTAGARGAALEAVRIARG
ncbi:MAG: ROK family protein [Planctomycetia bacterium]